MAPTPIWGRDELDASEMWNSNPVIAWLIARAGIPTAPVHPPPNGRAPGRNADRIVVRRHHRDGRTGGVPTSRPASAKDAA